MGLLQWQVDAEGGRTRFRFALDQTAVLTDDALRDRKAQSGTVRATADHRVVHSVEESRGNAGPVCGYVEPQYEAVTRRADRELADDPRAESDLRSGRLLECLLGVARDVQQRLDQL